VAPAILKVDAARLRSLAGKLSDVAAGLTAAPSQIAAGPSWQPSAAAAGDVSTGIDHVDSECSKALADFGSNLTKAADAYDATDAAGAAAVSRALPDR
jgi:hypothetical protein